VHIYLIFHKGRKKKKQKKAPGSKFRVYRYKTRTTTI